MTLKDFWNQSFIAALGRLPAAEAVAEANLATELSLAHWQKNFFGHVPMATRLMDLDLVTASAQVRGEQPLFNAVSDVVPRARPDVSHPVAAT